MLPKTNPTTTQAWEKLRAHFYKMETVKMQELFAQDTHRTKKMHVQWNDFIIDYSKNRISDETLQLLQTLAEEIGLKQAIHDLFNGEKINETENRSVLHTALRNFSENTKSSDYHQEIFDNLKKMKAFSEKIISGELKGSTAKKFTDILNIGIGGSDLGPKMVVETLSDYKNHLKTHFISNIDADAIDCLLNTLNPETTLVLVVSKSFGTKETLLNAELIKHWFLKNNLDSENHFVGITANQKAALKFGILQQHLFPMWDFVGGRYSLWSAVGLSIALSIGYENFEALLLGAHELDIHFKSEKFSENIPVLLALLTIWYTNFYQFENHVVVPYCSRLQSFTNYLQQLVMESNGKNTDREQNPVNYQTSPAIWGEIGTNSQHAFFQLFHQGTKIIPTDFIGFIKPNKPNKLHDVLLSNMFAQAEALMNGKDLESSNTEDKNAAYKEFYGNRPSTTFLIQKLTPKNLGSLLAIYEHKTFVEGIIWNIYSFDQFGIEYGKVLADTILKEIQENKIGIHDSSTSFLMQQYLEKK